MGLQGNYGNYQRMSCIIVPVPGRLRPSGYSKFYGISSCSFGTGSNLGLDDRTRRKLDLEALTSC